MSNTAADILIDTLYDWGLKLSLVRPVTESTELWRLYAKE